MEPVEVINNLNKMKDILLNRGWTKSKLEDSNGRLCILGARNLVVYGSSLNKESLEDSKDGYLKDDVSIALTSVLDEKIIQENLDYWERDHTSHLYTFNDCNDVGFNDIINLIDKAVVIQKEKL